MRVAAIQTTATEDRRSNLAAAGALVARAAGDGAELVVLPEYFSLAGSPRVLRQGAEPPEGPTLTWAAEIASLHRLWLVAGSFPEAVEVGTAIPPGGTAIHNTSCLVGPDGAVTAAYQKIHLFDVAIEGAASTESATIVAGKDLVVTRLGAPLDCDLGLSICYDLRFPEVYRILTLRGATVVAVPSAFTAATGPSHWELLLRARAVENQVFVIGAGQVGRLPAGMPPCHGHSMIVDPWGDVLVERRDPTPGVVITDLDLAGQRRLRPEQPGRAPPRPPADAGAF
jgi:predicted amidohydrolase